MTFDLSSNTSNNFTDPSLSGFKASTATLTKTNDTVLETVPGMSVPLQAGKTYVCYGHLVVTATTGTGIKVALVGSNGLTLTSYSATGGKYNANAIGPRVITTTPDAVITTASAAVSELEIWATLVVNVAGTINVQAAQNVADGGNPTAVLVNSTFQCVRIN